MMVGLLTIPIERKYLGLKVSIVRNFIGLLIAIIVSVGISILYGELL
jgi:hypothetical protein